MGRAAQLIRGAEAARGEWLLFLHADTALSRDWTERVADHLESRPDKAAVFSLVYRSDARMAKRIASRANRRTRWLGLPYGDQGLLIPRKLYDEIGGYDDIPLMEDVRIVQAIGRKRLAILSAEARTSAAKYERDGWRRRSCGDGSSRARSPVRYMSGAASSSSSSASVSSAAWRRAAAACARAAASAGAPSARPRGARSSGGTGRRRCAVSAGARSRRPPRRGRCCRRAA